MTDIPKKTILYISIVLIMQILLLSLYTLDCLVYQKIVGIDIIILNVLCVFNRKLNLYMKIILSIVLYTNYSIIVPNYLIDSWDSFFFGYKGTTISFLALKILFLFSIYLYVSISLLPISHTANRGSLLLNNNSYNSLLLIFIALVLFIILIYGYTRPDEAGERGAPTTYYEYSIILFIIAFYYCGNKSNFVILFLVIASLFAFQNLIFGGRITALQILLLVYLCVFVDRFSPKVVLLSVIFAYLIMHAVGTYRGDIMQFFSNQSTFTDSLSLLLSRFFTLDTAQSAFYTSCTFLSELNYADINMRLNLLAMWFISIFAGKIVPDSNLSVYTNQYYVHYFGGILPFYFYFYLGSLGIVGIATYIHCIFRMIQQISINSNALARCLVIYLTTTTFRWYVYTPSQLFRGVLIFSFLFFLSSFLEKHKCFSNKPKEALSNND